MILFKDFYTKSYTLPTEDLTEPNKKALLNIKKNAEFHNVVSKIKIIYSDLFENVNEKFDKIFWNVPFVEPLIEKENLDILDKAIYDKNYFSIEKFLKQAKYFLKDEGRIFIGFSSDLGDFKLLKELSLKNNLKIKTISEDMILSKRGDVRIPLKFELLEIIYVEPS